MSALNSQSNENSDNHNDLLDIPGICITSLWRRPFNVVFRVGAQRARFYCHKEVLRANSKLFSQKLKDTQDSIIIDIPDVSKEAFQAVVRHIYSNDLAVKYSFLVEAMVAANRFQFRRLEKALLKFAHERTNYSSAVTLYKQFENIVITKETSVSQLKKLALKTIDKYGINALTNMDFNSLTYESLCELLERDTLRIQEMMLISMSILWAKHKCGVLSLDDNIENIRLVLGESFYLIRFPLLTVDDLFSIYLSNFIITKEEYDTILTAIIDKTPGTVPFNSTTRASLGYCLQRFKKEDLKIQKRSMTTFHQIDLKLSQRIRLVAIGVYLPKGFHDIEGSFLMTLEVYNSNSMIRMASLTKRTPFGYTNIAKITHFIFTSVIFLEANIRYSLVLNTRFVSEQSARKKIATVSGKKGCSVMETCNGGTKITWKFMEPKAKFGIYSHLSNKSYPYYGQFPEIIYDLK